MFSSAAKQLKLCILHPTSFHIIADKQIRRCAAQLEGPRSTRVTVLGPSCVHQIMAPESF